MTEEQRGELQQKILLDAFQTVTTALLIGLSILGNYIILHPDAAERLKERWEKIKSPPERPDPHEHEVRRFRSEISNWEHAEQEK